MCMHVCTHTCAHTYKHTPCTPHTSNMHTRGWALVHTCVYSHVHVHTHHTHIYLHNLCARPLLTGPVCSPPLVRSPPLSSVSHCQQDCGHSWKQLTIPSMELPSEPVGKLNHDRKHEHLFSHQCMAVALQPDYRAVCRMNFTREA